MAGVGLWFALCAAGFAVASHIVFARFGKPKTEAVDQDFQNADAINRNLIRVLCHDMGNTVTAVLGAASRALRTATMTPERNRELWDRAYRASIMQRELIEHVKQMETVRDRGTAMTLEAVDLNDVIENARFVFDEVLRQKSIQLDVQFDQSTPHLVVAERVSLCNSVFNNLVSNAIKFSPRDGVIKLSLESDHRETKLMVSDHGIGIPKELLSNLFDVSTSREGTEGESGSGLGLAIAYYYMASYGGAITVESTTADENAANHGTEFTLSFCTDKKTA